MCFHLGWVFGTLGNLYLETRNDFWNPKYINRFLQNNYLTTFQSRRSLLGKSKTGYLQSAQLSFYRTKDGGAIVKFSFKSAESTKTEVAEDIVHQIENHIQRLNIRAPFNFQQVRAFLVKGEPFLEDMLARYPTQRLRIEFQGDPVCFESLYRRLRPYGKIFDIALYPNPNMGKDPSRYAIVQFTRMRSATSARNCLHGHLVDNNTRLNVLYERQMVSSRLFLF